MFAFVEMNARGRRDCATDVNDLVDVVVNVFFFALFRGVMVVREHATFVVLVAPAPRPTPNAIGEAIFGAARGIRGVYIVGAHVMDDHYASVSSPRAVVDADMSAAFQRGDGKREICRVKVDMRWQVAVSSDNVSRDAV